MEREVCAITPCPFCDGGREDCEQCEGKDRMPIFECPNKLVQRAHLDCVTACALTERGLLPDPGGWQDQATTFVQAFPLVMREINHWREVARRKAQADAERRTKGR